MATMGQKKFLSRISDLSKDDRFCDIELEFSDGSRRFNRLVLAALSPFFDVMLSSAMKEGLSGIVKLPTVSSEVFDAVISFYIEGEGELNEASLYEAIDAAEMMDLPDLKELYIRNMRENLNPDRCLRIWLLSQKYTSDKELTDKAMELVVDNLGKIQKQPEFLSLTQTDVIKILRSRHHKILQDSQVFDAVMGWIEANHPDESCAMELFRQVRLQLMEPGDILKKTFQYRDLLNKNKEIEKIIEQYAIDGAVGNPVSTNKDRTPDLHNVIIVCSSSSESVLQVHAWHLKKKMWFDLSTDIPTPVEDFTAAAAGYRIVVTGGKGNDVVLSESIIFDTFTVNWEEGPDLVEARCRHGSVTVNDCVYVLGGYQTSYLSTIEQLSNDQNKWNIVGNLFTAVADPAVEHSGRCILIMGGTCQEYNSQSRPSDTIQCFHTESRCTSVIGRTPGIVFMSASSSPYIFLLSRNNRERHLSFLSIEESDGEVKMQYHKSEMSLPYDVTIGKHMAFVVTDGKGIIYTKNFTRQIDVTAGKHLQVVLPSIPGPVEAVECAFQTVVAQNCLHGYTD